MQNGKRLRKTKELFSSLLENPLALIVLIVALRQWAGVLVRLRTLLSRPDNPCARAVDYVTA